MGDGHLSRIVNGEMRNNSFHRNSLSNVCGSISDCTHDGRCARSSGKSQHQQQQDDTRMDSLSACGVLGVEDDNKYL